MLERVRITVRSGRVRVTGEARDGVDVEGASVSGAEPELSLKGGSKKVVARIPETADLVVGSHSGNVTIDGSVGGVSVTTSSADVEAEEVQSIDARTSSGGLRIGTSHGAVRLRSTSSTVRVNRVDGEVHVATVSGTVAIADARGPVTVKTVSGSIDVAVDGSAPVVVETVSGTIVVRVPDGARPDVKVRTISGNQHIEVETGADVSLTLRSVSGNVSVVGP